MSEQIREKLPETLKDQIDQFKDVIELSQKERDLIQRYSEQLVRIIDLNILPENLPGDLVDFIKKHRNNCLRILREHRKKNEFEDFSDMRFEEVGDTDNSLNVIEISANSNETQEEVEKKLQEHLKDHNWWLQDYWRKKGLPKEQFTISTENGDIQIYNFSEALTERHIQELQNLMQVFIQARDKSPLQEIKYILLDDLQHPNPNTGEDMNGYGPVKEKAIKLYPRGQQFIPHRVPEASNFEGTTIHELSHGFSVSLINEWANAFGWKMLDTPIQLPGGAYQYYGCTNPEKCISDYAKISPSEDICESMVAAIKVPEKLDPDRLAFIQKKIFGDSRVQSPVEIKKQQNIFVPNLNQPIKYKRKKPKKFKL